MKPEYYFYKAERGKFYKPDTSFEFPIYFKPDVNEFFNKEHKGRVERDESRGPDPRQLLRASGI